jgi:hypothetical protein
MPALYLDWLADVLEEAQVPLTPENADYIDKSLRRIVEAEGADEEVVYRRIRDRWLRQGPSGRQLLAAFIRDEAYARRDSPMRPHEGQAYYTNEWKPKPTPPGT